MDVIIIGGGILGVSLAFHASRAGLCPLVVERGEPGGGTTSASFAWANASTKTGDAAYHRLNVAGMAGFRALAEEFGAEVLGIDPAGALQVVARSDGPGYRAMLRDHQVLGGFGYRAELLDHAALRALAPELRLAGDAEALHLPDDLIIDAPRFTRFLAGQVTAGGGRIVRAEALRLLADDTGRVQGVETSAGAFHAPVVVTAAGKDTGALLAQLTGHAPLEAQFPLREVPGLLLTTPPLPALGLSHLVYTSTTQELHFLPLAGGRIRIGSDDIDALIWEDRSEAAMAEGGRALLERARAFLPGLNGVEVADCHLAVGIRPYPEDGRAIVDLFPGADGLFTIATHSGITLAPVIGQLVARWIASGARPEALAPYALTRFAGFRG